MGDEADDAESQNDDFTAKDAFFLGGAMGWVYEEGLDERHRKQLSKDLTKGENQKNKKDN